MLVFETHSAAETKRLARRLGEQLHEAARIALSGPLGAGKTVFAQGLALGLGIDEPVTSPTFILIKSYLGRLPLHHCDWYRLSSRDDVASSGFDDLELSPGVVVVEWADKFERVLDRPFLNVRLHPSGERSRKIEFSVAGKSKTLRGLVGALQ